MPASSSWKGKFCCSFVWGKWAVLHVNRVVRGLGYGLDESALAAANLMRFKPALRNGVPCGIHGSRTCRVSACVLRLNSNRVEKGIRVMRTWKWMFTAFLLAGLSATAQQTAGQTSSEPSAAPQQATPQSSQPADAAPASAPTTLNQVVDRAIAREHALVTMLAKRTPLVETYLQNMRNDAQLGPAPTSDHYYFGRIDMGETVCQDYLSKGSFQGRLLGGFSKLFKYVLQSRRLLLDGVRGPRRLRPRPL